MITEYKNDFYNELLELKSEGKLKPIDSFTRDELKILIHDEFVSIEELAKLFNVSKHKISTVKRDMRLRDQDMIQNSMISLMLKFIEDTQKQNEELIEYVFQKGEHNTIKEYKEDLAHTMKVRNKNNMLDVNSILSSIL